MMKKVVVLIAFLFVSLSYSQITFTLNSNLCSGNSKTLTANTGTDVALSYTWSSTPAIPVFSSPNSSITTINFPSTGTFTINLDVTLSIGTGSYSTVVNVASTPTILVSQSSATVCMASNYPQYTHPVFLTASGGSSTYTWNPPIYDAGGGGVTYSASVFVRPPVSTCYTVSSIVGSCIGKAVNCVSVIPQYSFAVSPSSGTVCILDSLHLSVSNISTLAVLPIQNYIWYDAIPVSIDNPYNPTVTVYPSVTCTYSVEIFDNRACVSLPVLVNVTVASCTGIHSNSLDNSVLIYPNPFINQLTLNTNSSDLKKLVITNALGKIVYTSELYQNTTTLDLTQIPSGTYVAELYINKQFNFRKKLIKCSFTF